MSSDSWKCKFCTFDNDVNHLACAMCGSAKPTEHNGWSCLICTFDGNIGDVSYCQMCGNEKQQINVDSSLKVPEEVQSFKHDNQILAEITKSIYTSPLVVSVKGITVDVCKEIALYSKDWWTWNPNCSGPSLIGQYNVCKHSKENEELYYELINGNFTLTALLKTPSEFTKWNGFLGGPKGSFWIGAMGQKWCVGKQGGMIHSDFCLFGEKPNVVVDAEVYVMLIREDNDWELYLNGNLITRASCHRTECAKLGTFCVGSGDVGSDRWMGAVHSIMIRPGIWKDK